MTPEQVTALFLASSLTSLVGDANYEQFKVTRTELFAILVQVTSPLGGGGHGLICLACSHEAYKTETGKDFDRPERPETYDPTIDDETTEGARHKKTALWESHKQDYQVYLAAEAGGKALLLAAYGEVYFRSLKNKLTGYINVTLQDMLAHVSQGWGEQQPADIAAIILRLARPYYLEENILEYFEEQAQLFEILDTLDMGFKPKLKITVCLAPLKASGEFKDELRDWKHDPKKESWSHFQATMLTAYQKAIQDQRSEGTLGSFEHKPRRVHHANVAEEETNPPAQAANAVAMVVDGLDTLAAAVTTDRARLDELLGTNKTLTDQIAKLTTQNGKLVDIVARKGGGTAPAAAAVGKKGKDPWADADWDPKGYCWTHGHKVRKGHNSITCNSRSWGHQVSAKKYGREQTKKGSSVNWKWEETAEE